MNECQRLDCYNPGTHAPILKWRPINTPDFVGEPYQITLNIRVCADCSRDKDATEALRIDMLLHTAELCRSQEKIPPDPDTAVLEWVSFQ